MDTPQGHIETEPVSGLQGTTAPVIEGAPGEQDRLWRPPIDWSKVTVDIADAAVVRVMSWMDTTNFRWERTPGGGEVLYLFTTADGARLATYSIMHATGGGVDCRLNGTFQGNDDYRSMMLSMIETEIDRRIRQEANKIDVDNQVYVNPADDSNAVAQVGLSETLIADILKATGVLRAIEDMTAGITLHLQASYVQMLTALAVMRPAVGTSLTVAWNEGETADGVIEERQFVLPASEALPTIHSTANLIQAGNTLIATGQLIQPVGSHIGVASGSTVVKLQALSLRAETPPMHVMPTLIEAGTAWGSEKHSWELTIDADDDGVRSAHFVARDKGARAKLASVVSVASSLMSGEVPHTSLKSTTVFRRTDSAHFAHPIEKRISIVEHYQSAKPTIANKDAWAQANYQITGKTLRRYENEYKGQPDT